jgi:hypothetical protein
LAARGARQEPGGVPALARSAGARRFCAIPGQCPAAAFRRGNPPPPTQTVLADDAHPRSPRNRCQHNRSAVGCATRRRRGETAPRPPPLPPLRPHRRLRIPDHAGSRQPSPTTEQPSANSDRMPVRHLDRASTQRIVNDISIARWRDDSITHDRPSSNRTSTPSRAEVVRARDAKAAARGGIPPPAASCAADSTAVVLASISGGSGTRVHRRALSEPAAGRFASPKSRRRASPQARPRARAGDAPCSRWAQHPRRARGPASRQRPGTCPGSGRSRPRHGMGRAVSHAGVGLAQDVRNPQVSCRIST